MSSGVMWYGVGCSPAATARAAPIVWDDRASTWPGGNAWLANRLRRLSPFAWNSPTYRRMGVRPEGV